MLAMLAFGVLGACKQTELIGANCPTPSEACAGKSCGDECSSCSSGSVAGADIVGHCGANGVCSASAPTCSVDASRAGSPGCGKTGAATGQLTKLPIMVGGQRRTYELSVPTGYTGSTPLALVFAWHGANIDGETARRFFNVEDSAGDAAIVVYPDGSQVGWDASAGSSDLQVYPTLRDALLSSYCIDPQRIFSTGHSTGAVFTNVLGCLYGDSLRAIAPVEGTPPTGTCAGKVAAIIVHGQNDPLIPIAQGQATRDFFLKQNGCSMLTSTWAAQPACVEYQGCSSDLPLLWCVHDEGHSWPVLTAPDCRGGICFDAGAAIWAFFFSFR
jgi:poly(3-hydroxybutyrate) depolymerase